MKPATRHIASILFLLLGITPVLFVLLFSLKQQIIRKEMKEKMETEQLHTIVMADKEIQWAKAGKEIWIDGKMFDIKSVESKDGITTFKGLFDNEETLLKKNLEENWKKTNQNQLFTQLFQTLQSIHFTSAGNIFSIFINQSHIDSYSTPTILSQFLEIPTPPPLA